MLTTAIVAIAMVSAAPAGARPARGAVPRVTIDRGEAAPGETVVARVDGFTGNAVTVSVCGNAARRGSADCNMASSATEGLGEDGTAVEELRVQPPPGPCPCVVRVTSTSTLDVAATPLVVLGHPTGAAAPLTTGVAGLDVEVSATPEAGLVAGTRRALGGRTTYDLRVVVHNRMAEPVSGLVVRARADHRLRHDAATARMLAPATIEPGSRWVGTTETDVRAPVIGRYTWQVSATATGIEGRAAARVDHLPVVLLVLVVLLTADLALLAARRLRRARRESGDRRRQTGALRTV